MLDTVAGVTMLHSFLPDTVARATMLHLRACVCVCVAEKGPRVPLLLLLRCSRAVVVAVVMELVVAPVLCVRSAWLSPFGWRLAARLVSVLRGMLRYFWKTVTP